MSNLINKTRLQKFAEGLWTKIKDRYDNAFKDAEISSSTGNEKHITFKRINEQNPLKVSLADYARLQDKNDFKQDVSADNVAIINNKYIGSNVHFDSQNRGLGFRQLTTNAFADGYVDHIRIYLEGSATGNATFKVWAITKDANDKAQDRVAKVILNSEPLEVNSITEGTATRKFVIIPVKDSFENETYFIARCSTHKVEVAQPIDPKYANDVVNLNSVQPPDEANSQIDWTGVNNTDNTAIMYLYGRESIGSLSLKLRQTQADGSLYVKQAEVSTAGGTNGANKVVRLGADGKLDKDMLPSIAINKYFEITDFTNPALQNQTYENGDVAVVTGNGANRGKRYLCINKVEGATNSTNDFIELNSKDGSVLSVNERTGAVELNLEATDDKFKLKISGTGGNEVVKEIPMISDQDITEILSRLN